MCVGNSVRCIRFEVRCRISNACQGEHAVRPHNHLIETQVKLSNQNFSDFDSEYRCSQLGARYRHETDQVHMHSSHKEFQENVAVHISARYPPDVSHCRICFLTSIYEYVKLFARHVPRGAQDASIHAHRVQLQSLSYPILPLVPQASRKGVVLSIRASTELLEEEFSAESHRSDYSQRIKQGVHCG